MKLNCNDIVELKMNNGYTINGVKHDLQTERIEKTGKWDPPLSQFIERYLATAHKPVCVDVGANIGAITLTMCKYSAQVIAFEPIKFIHQLLESTLKQNSITNCTAINLALGDSNGQAILHINQENNLGASSIHHKNSEQHTYKNPNNNAIKESIAIDIKTGDTVPEINNSSHIDLIKIDVEGHEPNVLAGLEKCISKHNPIIVIEWNCNETRNGFEEKALFSTLLKNYKQYAIVSHESAFRDWTRKYSLLKPIKPIMRSIYRRLIKKDVREGPCLDIFRWEKDYSSIVFIPHTKYSQLNKANILPFGGRRLAKHNLTQPGSTA